MARAGIFNSWLNAKIHPHPHQFERFARCGWAGAMAFAHGRQQEEPTTWGGSPPSSSPPPPISCGVEVGEKTTQCSLLSAPPPSSPFLLLLICRPETPTQFGGCSHKEIGRKGLIGRLVRLFHMEDKVVTQPPSPDIPSLPLLFFPASLASST